MVAVIKGGRSIKNVLYYNERKVDKGVAELLHAVHFPKDREQLAWGDKMGRFGKLISLNQQTRINTLHISLNFDPAESLKRETLVQIAETYMEGIGFGRQPYLVYQHYDASHPHLHVVTTPIRRDGSRISLHYIGQKDSEKIRKEIENKFGLVRARKKQKESPSAQVLTTHAGRAQYGKEQTKAAIMAVVNRVMKEYHYSSFTEFNAILADYGVVADRGSETSRIYKHSGLVYRMLTEKGEKKGVPIKASSMEGKPTLLAIRAQFPLHREVKEKSALRVKNRIDLSFHTRKSRLLAGVKESLGREGIHMNLVRNSESKKYEIIYVDHTAKCAFTGGDLGRAYELRGLLDRCGQRLSPLHGNGELGKGLSHEQNNGDWIVQQEVSTFFDALTTDTPATVPQELLVEEKKKKKKLKH